jgi:hypothetical protein
MTELGYKLFAFGAIYIVSALCIVFYAIGDVGTRDEISKEYDIPSSTFEAWFSIGILAIVLLGFSYAMFNVKIMTISYLLPATVALVSLVLLYVKLFFSLRTGLTKYTEVQTFAFNVVINSFVLIIYTILTSKRYISATLALFPLLGFSIYFLYIGHLLAQ